MSAVPAADPDLAPDFDEARSFLAALARDPDDTRFLFLTIDDKKKDETLRTVVHGTFDEAAEQLADLNARGAGVFVTVNRTKGKSRKKEDVSEVRAAYADLDGVPLENIKRLALAPHITVETSPGKWHVYYRTLGVPVSHFEAIQTALIERFGSDPQVKGPERVMRLPGFWHQKGKPFRTKIVDVKDGRPYGLSDFPKAPDASDAGSTADNVVAMPQPEEREKALAMAQEKARRTHNTSTGRRSAMAQLAYDLAAAKVSRPTANLAAKVFAKECRPTDSEGQPGAFPEKDALDLVANAYRPGKVVNPRTDDGSEKRKREAAVVAEMNKKHALILIGGKPVILRERPDRDADFIKQSGFEAFYRNEFVGKKSKATLWLSHPARRTFEEVVFAPARHVEGAYNLWGGFAVAPSDKGSCAIFLDHLCENVAQGDVDLFRWIEAWLAQIVQRPAEKVGTSLVLRGAQGTGKTKVGEVMSKLLGSHYLLVDDPRYVVGNFNAHLTRVILLHADEAFFAGDRGSVGKLRSLVTGGKTMLEMKGLDPIEVDNFMRLLVTSDRSWVVPTALEERRFAVVDMSTKRRQDTAYFKAMDDELAAGGYGALLKHLLAVDINAVDLRSIPKTKALLDQKAHSMDSVQLFWYTRLCDGEIVIDHDKWPTEISKHDLYQEYLREARDTNQRYRLNDKQFGIELRKLCAALETCKMWVTFKRDDGSEDSKRVNGYRLPGLVECRAAFESAAGTVCDWPTSPEEAF